MKQSTQTPETVQDPYDLVREQHGIDYEGFSWKVDESPVLMTLSDPKEIKALHRGIMLGAEKIWEVAHPGEPKPPQGPKPNEFDKMSRRLHELSGKVHIQPENWQLNPPYYPRTLKITAAYLPEAKAALMAEAALGGRREKITGRTKAAQRVVERLVTLDTSSTGQLAPKV